jgi:PAS domain S-box-containing protein
MILDQTAEISRLRALLRDLFALGAVGDAWVGRDPAAIAAELADVLIESLELDFAYVHLCDPGGRHQVEAMRGDSWPGFPDWLQQRDTAGGQIARKEIVSNLSGMKNSCRGFIIPVGAEGERGLVAAACDRSDFPNDTDRQLLSVASNNAATAFHNACLINDLRSVQEELRNNEQELRNARDELEIKVMERTAELRRSESELRDVFDTIPAMVWSALPDGSNAYVNRRWVEYSDMRADQMSGFGWQAATHPDDLEQHCAKWLECIRTGRQFEDEVRFRLADGQYRWHLQRSVPLRDEGGNIVKWYGVLTDIDDRKRAEEQLMKSTREMQKNEFYLSEAQRLGHIGSWVLDPAVGFDYWSRELFVIYGLDPERNAPTLDEYLACVHPDDREFMASLIKRAIAEASGFDVTKRIVRPGGEVRHIRCVGAPVLENGTLKRIIGSAIDVTEHELLTRELRRREVYLMETQRLSHTGTFAVNLDTGERVWSDETYRIYEYDCAMKPTVDMILQRVHPQDRALAQQVIDRTSQTGEDYSHESRLLLADGRVKHLYAVAHALKDASGNREFVGAVTDITERKMAEEKIRRSERELRTLVEAIPSYVGTTLPDGSLDFISQSWLDYTGFSREQGRGWGWENTIHPEDLDRVVANWRASLAAGTPAVHELRCRSVDGTYHWFLNRTLPLRDDGGSVIKWYGTLTNIDALKETESALQMREHELLGIIETIPSMLWSLWPSGEPNHLSQRLIDFFGVPLEEFVNRGWLSLIHPDDREETAKVFFRAIETGESFSVMHRMRRADGEYRWHHAMGQPLRDPQGKIIQWYGLSIDVDERKRAEDHLRDTSIKLAKASRLATVAELAGSIAHELNQPLMSMLANAQAAKRWLNAAPSNVTEVNSSIERIIRDARAADETMQHIRALFKQESFERIDVKVPDILHEVIRIVQEDPKKGDVSIECDFEESFPAVSIDQIQIQQVFINLIVNAIEALEGQQMAPRVTLRAAVTDSDEMLIQVIDNGPGVHDPERIFDAFMTTKEKGMGIGLAVSRSIVEAHGGRLWAENNRTVGATFSVALPLSHASPATA